MQTYDPFKWYAGAPVGPASLIFTITPSDDADLTRGVKRLRVFNSLDTVAFIAVVPVAGTEAVMLPIPAMAVVWEDIRISKVLATGTEPTLLIHGYSD